MLDSSQRVFDRVLRAHHAVDVRVRAPRQSPGDVLETGRQLLAFAAQEDEAFRGVLPLLDPTVRQQLEADHNQIEEDLGLLQWLLANMPDSPDVAALSDSLLRRMAVHVKRDGRLLARAVHMGAR